VFRCILHLHWDCHWVYTGFSKSKYDLNVSWFIELILDKLPADSIFEYRNEIYDVFDRCFDILMRDSSHCMFLLAYALDPGKSDTNSTIKLWASSNFCHSLLSWYGTPCQSPTSSSVFKSHVVTSCYSPGGSRRHNTRSWAVKNEQWRLWPGNNTHKAACW
jgi:hypothetical protein